MAPISEPVIGSSLNGVRTSLLESRTVMSRTSKRSPSSMASWRTRGSCAKRTISSAVTERGLTATSIPARSKTSIEIVSWTIPIVKPMPCTLASIAA